MARGYGGYRGGGSRSYGGSSSWSSGRGSGSNWGSGRSSSWGSSHRSGGFSNRGSSGGSWRSSSSRGSNYGKTAQTRANSSMWGKSATSAQIRALKQTGNYDGKYYSRGRAGQAIGNSIRSSGHITSQYGFVPVVNLPTNHLIKPSQTSTANWKLPAAQNLIQQTKTQGIYDKKYYSGGRANRVVHNLAKFSSANSSNVNKTRFQKIFKSGVSFSNLNNNSTGVRQNVVQKFKSGVSFG